MEKQMAAARITRKFNFRKQGCAFIRRRFCKKQSLVRQELYALSKNKVNVKVYEEVTPIPMALSPKDPQKSYSSDSTSPELKQG